jgi:cyclase
MRNGSIDRRQVLRVLGTGIALAGVRSRHGLAAVPALSAAALRGGLTQIEGAGGNIVVLVGPEGLLLVDSGAAEHAGDLVELVTESFGSAPVRVLFNTHWHLDHTGGNDALLRGGVTAVAHENTRLWMSTKFFVDWDNRRYLPRAPHARPNQTFLSHERQPLELEFGAEKAIYAHLPGAHTDGDIYVRFPNHNVIVAGGALTANTYPVLDYITGGWIGGLVEATKTLLAMTDAETLIVPDAGPVQRRADLTAQLEMLEAVRERIEAIALEGRGVDDMIAANITREFDARFSGDSGLFIANSYESLWWNRLRGIVA